MLAWVPLTRRSGTQQLLLARLCGDDALGAQDRELIAVPLHATGPAERAVRSAEQRVGLSFEVSDSCLAGTCCAKTKDALTSRDAVNTALALVAASVHVARIPIWPVRARMMAAAMPAMVAAPVINVVVMAMAVAMPMMNVMMMAMTVPAMRICCRRFSDHQHGQGREQREAQFRKQLHLITPQKTYRNATAGPLPS